MIPFFINPQYQRSTIRRGGHRPPARGTGCRIPPLHGISCVNCLRIAGGHWPPLRFFRKLKADKHRLSGLRSKRLPARAIQFYDRWKTLWECCGNAVENRFAFGKARQSLPSFLIKPDSMKCVFWCACMICSCEMLPVYCRDPLGFRCFLYRYCIASVSCKTIYFQNFLKITMLYLDRMMLLWYN